MAAGDQHLPAVHATPNLRWGILGTARINDRFIEAVGNSDRSTVVAVASRNAEHAVEYARSKGIPQGLSGYQALIDAPGIDAVYVSLPNSLHAEYVIKLGEAGKHVLCEKPLALTSADVAAIRAAALATGVVIQEATATRFQEQTSYVADMVQSGEIGEVCSAQASFGFLLPGGPDIRLQSELGGGALWDLGCYPISYFQAILQENPTYVTGVSKRRSMGVDMTFSAQLEYASGAVVQFVVSMEVPPNRSAQITGSKGMITIDYPWGNPIGAQRVLRIDRMSAQQGTGTFGDDPSVIESESVIFASDDAYFDELVAFEDIILEGRTSPFPLTDSLANTAVLVALHESAASGCRTKVNSSRRPEGR